MSLKRLPEIQNRAKPSGYSWEVPSEVLAKWSGVPVARDDDSSPGSEIHIFESIGQNPWSDFGVTAKKIAAALAAVGKNPVTVKINSPGGDMFEGVAIYNLLRSHPAEVNVEVLGIAASAASIIAMAGDNISMGPGTFLMVHNVWGLVVGNQYDMAAASTLFQGFDLALVDIYEARTGLARMEIERLMTSESFLAPSEAIKLGFADRLDESIKVDEVSASASETIQARRKLDSILASKGVPRVERRRLLRESFDQGGMPGATATVMPGADFDAAAKRFIKSLKPNSN